MSNNQLSLLLKDEYQTMFYSQHKNQELISKPHDKMYATKTMELATIDRPLVKSA